jgi:hypothetical protein
MRKRILLAILAALMDDAGGWFGCDLLVVKARVSARVWGRQHHRPR